MKELNLLQDALIRTSLLGKKMDYVRFPWYRRLSNRLRAWAVRRLGGYWEDDVDGYYRIPGLKRKSGVTVTFTRFPNL